ncbi:MAG: hypothetical protein R3292_00080 [Alcanivorax sp.]|nr:hypothetical protein [Alcanivorax sp.]
MRVLLITVSVLLVASLAWILRQPVATPSGSPAPALAAEPVQAQSLEASAPPAVSETASVPPGDHRPAAPLPQAVPTPPPAVVASLRHAMANGDPRTPPLVRPTDLRKPPSAAELADPQLYQQYETRQKMRVYAAFVKASGQKITKLETLIARGKQGGVSAAQLAEGQAKLDQLRQQRNKTLAHYPDLAKAAAPPPDQSQPD